MVAGLTTAHHRLQQPWANSLCAADVRLRDGVIRQLGRDNAVSLRGGSQVSRCRAAGWPAGPVPVTAQTGRHLERCLGCRDHVLDVGHDLLRDAVHGLDPGLGIVGVVVGVHHDLAHVAIASFIVCSFSITVSGESQIGVD